MRKVTGVVLEYSAEVVHLVQALLWRLVSDFADCLQQSQGFGKPGQAIPGRAYKRFFGSN